MFAEITESDLWYVLLALLIVCSVVWLIQHLR